MVMKINLTVLMSFLTQKQKDNAYLEFYVTKFVQLLEALLEVFNIFSQKIFRKLII